MKLGSFRKLSEEQDIIYNLPLNGSYLVSGPPGTGKTLIALHRASMYHNSGKEPIILSYSRLLSNYTAEAANTLHIPGTISTYHRWVTETYTRHLNADPPKVQEWVYDWTQITNDLFAAMIDQKPCLLIDEGQDLPADFYMAASLLAENIMVFADENQRITQIQSTIDDIRINAGIPEQNEYRLTKNYRNTLEIAKVAACYYAGLRGGIPELPDRRGGKPVIRRTINLQEALDFIVRFERNNPQQVIGLFTKTLWVQGMIHEHLTGRTANPVQVYHSKTTEVPSFSTPGIKLITLQSAKGLEFDTVFIPEIQKLGFTQESMEHKMQFYVALSRAREQLFLFYSGNGLPDFLELIPDELIEKD